MLTTRKVRVKCVVRGALTPTNGFSLNLGTNGSDCVAWKEIRHHKLTFFTLFTSYQDWTIDWILIVVSILDPNVSKLQKTILSFSKTLEILFWKTHYVWFCSPLKPALPLISEWSHYARVWCGHWWKAHLKISVSADGRRRAASSGRQRFNKFTNVGTWGAKTLTRFWRTTSSQRLSWMNG